MTEVKCKEAPREEYLKGPILTRRLYAEKNVDSLSKSSKMEIHHLQARFPGIYVPRSVATPPPPPLQTLPPRLSGWPRKPP